MIGLICFFIGFSLGFMCGGLDALRGANKEAVKEGHAEYYLDKNHKRKWRWKKLATQ